MGITATSYSINHGKAFAGMIADGQLANIISKLNKSGVTIPYGKAVVRDGVDGAKLPVAGSTAEDFVGFAVRELNRSYVDTAGFGAVTAKDYSVMTAGPLWVKAAEAVVAGKPVYVRVGATGNGDVAAAEGAAGTLAIAIPGAKFVSNAAAGELVQISLVVGG